jgi:hypothetical protein
MRPRRTVNTDCVYGLPGGTEDNDLWTYRISTNEGPGVASVWVPTDEERAAIAAGENIRLIVFGTMLPPVALDLTDEALGKPEAT